RGTVPRKRRKRRCGKSNGALSGPSTDLRQEKSTRRARPGVAGRRPCATPTWRRGGQAARGRPAVERGRRRGDAQSFGTRAAGTHVESLRSLDRVAKPAVD